MSLKIAGTDGNAILDALTVCDSLDVYGSIYGILQPPHCADDAVGDLMMSFDLSAATWGPASGGRLGLAGLPIIGTALLTAVPAYFRMTAGGVCKMQGKCGPQGFGADMQFPTQYIQAGAMFPLTELLFIEVNNDA